MGNTVKIDQLATEIMKGLTEYADMATDDMKEEWLDEFNTFSIYQGLPKLIELWGLNVQTDVTAKKNLAQLTDR